MGLYAGSAVTTNNLKAFLSANALYRYQVLVGTKMTIKANYSELYRRIVERSTKGGFFRTSTATSITEFTKVDELVEVKFESEENIPTDVRERLISTAKQRVVQRALDLVATN